MAILAGVGVTKINNIEKYKRIYDIKNCNISILNLINNSKIYCRKNNIPGFIYIDVSTNKIEFKCRNTTVYRFETPKKFRLGGVNIKSETINISSGGFTSSACTISFFDSNGGIHEVTIGVGTGNVEIKDDKRI